MKAKTYLLLALFMAMTAGAFAGIKTVSNNPSSPGQYTTLQAAIDAAGLGDTLMIAGSATNYGSVTISKPLVLVGAGYNNPYGSNTSVDYIYLNRTSQFLGASGTKIMGISLTNYLYFNGNYSGGNSSTQNIDNVLVERCRISTIGFQGYYYHNDTVRNCLFNNGSYIYFNSSTLVNIYIHNNIFDNASIQSGASNILSSVFLRNNLFINRVTATFYTVNSLIIENNIFYGSEPAGCTNCAFTKNITYLCSAVPGAGNVGSGNLNATNPMFVTYPPSGGAFAYTYDFHLQAGSPGKLAGTDGTDIGIYGGMLPYNVGAHPHYPQMMELTLPSGSSVPAGGTLNVHFKAKKQN
ncbi:MAG: hypothetical protein NTW16_18575 [Bacteroidetes bacterium]|nr:hypothetical protein [Bacteroidota bacterium]